MPPGIPKPKLTVRAPAISRAARSAMMRRSPVGRLSFARSCACCSRNLPREMRVVSGKICPAGVRREEDAVDQHAGKPREPGGEDAVRPAFLDLDEHPSAAVPGRERHRPGVEVGGLALERDVAGRVDGRPAHQSDIDREGLVSKIAPPVELDPFHELLGGALVAAPAAEARVRERAQSDPGDDAGPPGADLAQQRRDDAGGKGVGGEPFFAREALHRGRPAPVAADDARDHALVGEAVESATLPVPDPEGVHEGEVPRVAGVEERAFEHREQRVRLEEYAGAGEGHRRAVRNARDDVFRREGGDRVAGGPRCLAGRTPHSVPLSDPTRSANYITG